MFNNDVAVSSIRGRMYLTVSRSSSLFVKENGDDFLHDGLPCSHDVRQSLSGSSHLLVSQAEMSSKVPSDILSRSSWQILSSSAPGTSLGSFQ